MNSARTYHQAPDELTAAPPGCPLHQTFSPLNEDYLEYHDREWGRPTTDPHHLFEKICLEGFQSGLSWLTILRKREDGDPCEPRLEPFETDLLEEAHVVDDRPTPLVVVVLVVELGRAGPPTAGDAVVADDDLRRHSITPITSAPSAARRPMPPVAPRTAGELVC